MPTFSPLLRTLADLFPASERLWLVVVVSSAVVMALFEALGVASIVPFMAVVMKPESLDAYPAIGAVTAWAGVHDRRGQLVFLGIATALMVIASNGASALGLYLQQRFVARTRLRLTTTLFDGYLRLPYAFHTQRDSASLLKVIYGDAESVARLIGAAVQLVARSFVILALLALLLLRNPAVAMWTLAGLGGAYLFVYQFVRRKQEALGQLLSTSSASRHRASQEGLGGVKDLLVLGREDAKAQQFWEATRDVSYASAKNVLAGGLPKFLLEPIAFVGILAVALSLIIRSNGDASETIPTLALYAFVGYRLLPALQQVFTAAVDIKFTAPSLHALQADWLIVQKADRGQTELEPSDLDRRGTLTLENVCFTYPGAKSPALENVSLELRQGESIGLVGRTGSGKTTLADVVLGLYQPDSGTIRIGMSPLTPSSARAWRRRVGYVPQQVFLANASIAENIAFGLPINSIDRNAVEEAARLAQAEEFVRELPLGLDTLVGERGIRLSGGQRQRLGIARALYQNPDILVFDEATSALDGMTEDAVMDAIHALSGSRSVILIAHRLRTVEACDRIVVLEKGRVEAVGTYEELARSNTRFQLMIGAGTNDMRPKSAASTV